MNKFWVVGILWFRIMALGLSFYAGFVLGEVAQCRELGAFSFLTIFLFVLIGGLSMQMGLSSIARKPVDAALEK